MIHAFFAVNFYRTEFLVLAHGAASTFASRYPLYETGWMKNVSTLGLQEQVGVKADRAALCGVDFLFRFFPSFVI